MLFSAELNALGVTSSSEYTFGLCSSANVGASLEGPGCGRWRQRRRTCEWLGVAASRGVRGGYSAAISRHATFEGYAFACGPRAENGYNEPLITTTCTAMSASHSFLLVFRRFTCAHLPRAFRNTFSPPYTYATQDYSSCHMRLLKLFP